MCQNYFTIQRLIKRLNYSPNELEELIQPVSQISRHQTPIRNRQLFNLWLEIVAVQLSIMHTPKTFIVRLLHNTCAPPY